MLACFLMNRLGIFCFGWAIATAWAAPPLPGRIRESAAKGLILLQSTQKSWRQECYSCHQQGLADLAIRTAREYDIFVDENAARVMAAHNYARFADLDRAVQYTHEIDPALDDGSRLLAANAAGVRPSLTTAIYARLLASRQKTDGHWDTIDVRPPQSYSAVTATAVAIRAIQLYGHKNLAADTKARADRARKWLLSVSIAPGITEERSMQLFGLAWTGADRATLAPIADKLKSTQRPDGGWGSRDALPSDVYSTGEALVALHDAGSVSIQDAAWQRGIQFLIDKQAADGSWHVVSRLRPPAPVSPPYFETGYPYRHDQFISAMGASWAVRALSEALGEPRKIETPEIREANPTDVEPWVETAIFGSTADLKALLDKGLNPKAATKGGLTLLMLAQPDLEKTKLLISQGADVNARSKIKYSALMVAARYPEAAPSMNLLLDRGATLLLPRGSSAPVFSASALFAATQSRNAAIIPRLCKAGDNANAKTMIMGQFPSTPVLSAVAPDGAPVLKALLDCGAKADTPDDDGITALGWAAINNDIEVAKLLLARGAVVNHVDKKGMTPLMYAASIDFGDSTMVDLLLKAGASPALRSREGRTAAELARAYQHSQLLKSLK